MICCLSVVVWGVIVLGLSDEFMMGDMVLVSLGELNCFDWALMEAAIALAVAMAVV